MKILKNTTKNRKDLYIDGHPMKQKDDQGKVFFDICFCPYCKILKSNESQFNITDKSKSEEKENKESDIKYKCPCCLKIFSIAALINQSKINNKSFQLSKDTKLKGTTISHIKGIVTKYHNKGHSYRRIHELTRFSIELIQKSINLKESYDSSSSISKEDLIKECICINKNDSMEVKIVKALKYGCSYKVIEYLFKISSKTITKNKGTLLLNPDQKVSYSDNKLVIKRKKSQ